MNRPLLALLALYFATRLVALKRLPIFLDEISHIRWSFWIAEGQKLTRPWAYGKGLSIWLNALVAPFAPDYLWASRALTVLFGAITLVATFHLARALFGERTAVVAGLLYIASPFALFYDRLALTDPFMATFATLALLWSVYLAQDGRVRSGVVTGLFLALGVLSKAVGALVFVVPLLAALLLGQGRAWRALGAAWATGGALVALPVWSLLMNSSALRVGLSEAASGEGEGAARVRDNLLACGEWLLAYWTWPVAVLVAVGVLGTLWRRSRGGLLLVLATAVPVGVLIAVSSIWFPRYLVFTVPPVMVLVARTLTALVELAAARSALLVPPRRALALLAVVLLAVTAPGLRVDVDLWTDPARAALPEVDHWQFVDGWPSGYGSVDTVARVRAELARHPRGVTVVTHSAARRTTALLLDLELLREPRVRVEDVRLGAPDAVPLLTRWASEQPTLLVVSTPGINRTRPQPGPWLHLGTLDMQTAKPSTELADVIYRLCVDCER